MICDEIIKKNKEMIKFSIMVPFGKKAEERDQGDTQNELGSKNAGNSPF